MPDLLHKHRHCHKGALQCMGECLAFLPVTKRIPEDRRNQHAMNSYSHPHNSECPVDLELGMEREEWKNTQHSKSKHLVKNLYL